MSWRNECHTEQYFSRDNAIARSTASGGTEPRTSKRSSICRKRRGGCSARVPVKVTRRAVSGCRPFRRMSTTSAAMHPARPIAAYCVGGGPLLPLASPMAVWVPLDASNRRSPDHTSSATSGGRASAISAASTHGCRMRLLRAAAHEPFHHEPSRRKQHERVSQRVAERAVRSPRFRGLVNRLAERQHVLLGHLVDAGNQQLDDEDEEKNCRDLKE